MGSHRIRTEGASHKMVPILRQHRPGEHGRSGDASRQGGTSPETAVAGRGRGRRDKHGGLGPCAEHVGPVGGERHDCHTAHGMSGEYDVLDVGGVQDRLEVVRQGVERKRRGTSGAGTMAALVIEHGAVPLLPQAAPLGSKSRGCSPSSGGVPRQGPRDRRRVGPTLRAAHRRGSARSGARALRPARPSQVRVALRRRRWPPTRDRPDVAGRHRPPRRQRAGRRSRGSAAPGSGVCSEWTQRVEVSSS